MSTNEKQNNVAQEEVRILLGAIEIMRKEILATVADAHASIISSVNEQMRSYREGILTRYGLIPSKRVQSEQSIETIEDIEEQSPEKPVEETIIVESTEETTDKKLEVTSLVETEKKDEVPIVETPDEIVVNELVVPNEEKISESIVEQDSEQPKNDVKDMLPKDMTKRLQEQQWFKVKDSDYLIRSLDMFDPDIKAFWINVLGDKTESEIMTFEGFAYQVTVGKEKSLWLRRWTQDQIKSKQDPSK